MSGPGTRRVAQRVAGVAVALLITGGIVALSYVPYAPHRDSTGVLRLSWRARGERIESCRRLTDEELERIPAHMRQREICEGITAPYRLRLYVDTALRIDDTIAGSGARRDGLVYVFREVEVPAGTYAVRVVLERIASREGRDERDEDRRDERDERQRREGRDDEQRERREEREGGDERERAAERARREELPPRVELATTATLRPREVLLITYDAERGTLVRVPPG